jgi:hypothetical protein
MQFHFWECINRNQTFILDSHRPSFAAGRRQFDGQEQQWMLKSNIIDMDRTII